MLIIGLGNPGAEYEGTRHNSGREAVMRFAKKAGFADFEPDKKAQALVTSGKIGKTKVTLVLPETFMNKSGAAVGKFAKGAEGPKKVKDPSGKSIKALPHMIVVHDDLDIPLGKAKMSWNKSSGGHKGLESVMRAVGTEAFYRIRIGITPATATGKLKKPDHDTITENFIVAEFKDKEADDLKKVIKKVVDCLEMAAGESPERAMSEYNAAFNK
ncbi:MAG: aminoacyl-tRNA hydrolase [Patescibacteria group bacterium]|nr:aminoacyl-tRNA hydrolase [Patescibacteria group bacterium]MDE2116628.1 aminoacyl-tRNA hydrolase [Patescibacteria group bacterium]